MPDGGDIVFIYDNTYEGLLTAIFEAYYTCRPQRVTDCRYAQLAIGERPVDIYSDTVKAERVADGIRKKIGADALINVYRCALSDEPDKSDAVYGYVVLGFKLGAGVNDFLTNDLVRRTLEISRRVGAEAYRMIEFLRFSEMEGGILYGEMEPKCDILAMLAPHFADRLNAIPWIIYDTLRSKAAIYDTREWIIRQAPTGMIKPEYSADEQEYRRLWRKFYETIAVEGRINHKLRQSHMPKYYWKNITEMQ